MTRRRITIFFALLDAALLALISLQAWRYL